MEDKVQPTDEIQVVNLQMLLMPNGELIYMGKTMGWYTDEMAKHLTVAK